MYSYTINLLNVLNVDFGLYCIIEVSNTNYFYSYMYPAANSCMSYMLVKVAYLDVVDNANRVYLEHVLGVYWYGILVEGQRVLVVDEEQAFLLQLL